MTLEIGLVLGVLVLVVVLMVTEALRIDVIALSLMVVLPWLGLIAPEQAFSGLASDAVVAVLAVMILSHGLDRAGVMRRLTRLILRAAGTSPRRITALVSVAAAVISSLMQNVGSAALMLPALLRIARRTGIPPGRLLMPVGFVAILGGTLTLVGSGPLIILNDLLEQSGEEPFGLFSVTPIGLALVAAGILYFLVLGDKLLPKKSGGGDASSSVQQELVETWELPQTTCHCVVPPRSSLVDRTMEDVGLWSEYGLHLLAMRQEDDVMFAPWRRTQFVAGDRLTLLGRNEDCARFMADHELETIPEDEAAGAGDACFAELIVPPRSPVVGHSLREVSLRRTWGVEPVVLLSGADQSRTDFSDVPLKVGDALVAYGPAGNLQTMGDGTAFALVSQVARDATAGGRPALAVLCAVAAVGLVLAGADMPVSLLTGAVGMILLKVVPVDEAYDAVDWRTFFLLAGLIPLGVAMDETGAARYLADALLALPHGGQPLVIMGGLALLATVFSLVMSNVGATVLLVPLVVALGQSLDISVRALALLVAVSTANSFLLPTHQVNALFMGPGGYRARDYLRAGSLFTVVFLVIAVGMVSLVID